MPHSGAGVGATTGGMVASGLSGPARASVGAVRDYMLGVTLLTGVLFVENLFAQHLVHKTTLSIAAWVVFGTLLIGRWRFGWRGRRAVRLLLSGMGVLLLAFFGSKFVLELLLSRGT